MKNEVCLQANHQRITSHNYFDEERLVSLQTIKETIETLVHEGPAGATTLLGFSRSTNKPSVIGGRKICSRLVFVRLDVEYLNRL